MTQWNYLRRKKGEGGDLAGGKAGDNRDSQKKREKTSQTPGRSKGTPLWGKNVLGAPLKEKSDLLSTLVCKRGVEGYFGWGRGKSSLMFLLKKKKKKEFKNKCK